MRERDRQTNRQKEKERKRKRDSKINERKDIEAESDNQASSQTD